MSGSGTDFKKPNKVWTMGERVEAFHAKTKTFRTGKIVAVHKSTGLYDVSFDEGGEALDVGLDVIRPIGHNNDAHERNASTSGTKSSLSFNVGDQVEANREGKGVWRYAVIARVHSDHSYDVVYTDRVRENRVPANFVHLLYESNNSALPTNSVDIYASPNSDNVHQGVSIDEICVGMIVEARYHGGKQFFTGTLTRISHRSFTVDITYEDGDSETFLPLEYIRLIPGKSVLTNTSQSRVPDSPKNEAPHDHDDPLFPVGTAVEGNFQGKNLWYPGTITRIRSVGGGEFRYAIIYKDGDSEENVPQNMIRRPKLRPLNDSSGENSKAVTGRSAPQTAPQPTSDTADSPLKNRKLAPAGAATQPHDHHHSRHKHEHDKKASVSKSIANYDSRMQDDDDHDIGNFGGGDDDDHNDGHTEAILSTKHAGDLFLASPKPHGKKHRHHHHKRHHRHRQETPTVAEEATTKEQAPVAAVDHFDPFPPTSTSRPQSRAAPTTIAATTAADGGRMVPEELELVKSGGVDKEDSKQQGKVGKNRVEANFQGKGVWFPGRVLRRRDDGTYDVEYDDGDKELHVPRQNIRSLHNNQPAADPKPKTVPTPAGVSNHPSENGTSTSKGQQEQQPVQEDSHVSTPSTAAATNGRSGHHHHRSSGASRHLGEFAVGDRVVANYRNQGTFLPGTIRKLHSHGITVDVVYDDDGEIEKKIPVDRVKKWDGISPLTTTAPSLSKTTGSADGRPLTAPFPSNAAASASVSASVPSTSRASNVSGNGAPGISVSELSVGAAVDVLEQGAHGWQIGRVFRLYPQQHMADVKLMHVSPLSHSDFLAMVPWSHIRPHVSPSSTVGPSSVVPSHIASGSISNNNNYNHNASKEEDKVALDEHDVAALREYVRRKDAEIERLRHTVAQLTATTGQQHQQQHPGLNEKHVEETQPSRPMAPMSTAASNQAQFSRPGRQLQANGSGPAANPANLAQAQYAHHHPGSSTDATAASSAATSSEVQALARANEELKRSVAFLGQKFTMVVEELVRVKDHEEKLAKHVKKQGEMLKRLYQERGDSFDL